MSRRPAPLDRRDVAGLGFLLLLGVGVPLALAAAAGAVGVLSNDDWVYALGAQSLYRTGAITMPGHTAAAVGQVVLAQPLLWLSGGATWAYTVFGLATGGLGIASTYLLGRQYLDRGAAAMVALLVLAMPGFVRQSAGFMTDVPAFALATLSLLLGVRWLRGGRRATLVASLAVGLVGVTVREFAIAAPAAVLVTSLAQHRARDRAFVVAMTGLVAAGIAGILLSVRSPAVAGGGLYSTPQLLRLYVLLGPAMTTVAAVLLPALVIAVVRRQSSLRPLHLLWAVAIVALAFVVPSVGPLVGQFWMAEGLVGNALLSGDRQPVIGPLAWNLSLALALAAGVLLAAVAARWASRAMAGASTPRRLGGRVLTVLRRPPAVLLVFLLGYAAEIAVVVSVGAYPLDRYLYPMIPAAAILLLRETGEVVRPRRIEWLGYAAFGWLAASAVAITLNSFAYDAARWHAGESAVAMGYTAETVDAGYNWVGYHTGGQTQATPQNFGLMWYVDGMMDAAPCAVVSNAPLDHAGYRLVRVDRTAYRQYLLVGPDQPLYLNGATDARCPAPAP